jgi:cytochrome c556
MPAWLFLSALVLIQDPTYIPVASVTEIMQTLVVPSSNEVFNVGLEFPEDDEGWKAIESNAIMQGREGWTASARSLTESARDALEAARARNTDEEAWFTLSDRVLESCSSCHDAYWIVD